MSEADVVVAFLLIGLGYCSAIDRNFCCSCHEVRSIARNIVRSMPLAIGTMTILTILGLEDARYLFELIWIGIMLGYVHVVIPAVDRMTEDRHPSI